VDFLARFADGSQQLIQVCADLSAPGTRARELGALACAAREHPTARLLVITLANELVREKPPSVQILPATDWLLTSP
jgi:hypothetical protein